MARLAKRNKEHTGQILENAAQEVPLAPIQLADVLGVKVSTLHQLMSRLRREGRLPPSTRQFGTKAAPDFDNLEPNKVLMRALPNIDDPPQAQIVDEWVRDQLAKIEGGSVLTDQQILQVLSRLGLKESGGTVQVQALSKLREYSAAASGTVGPPAPLTEADQVARLSNLMRAVGQRVARKAWEAAYRHSPAPESSVMEETSDSNPQASLLSVEETEGDAASAGDSGVG